MTSELTYLGIKLYGRLHEITSNVLNDLAFIKKEMVLAANLGNMEIVGESYHQFLPHGVSVGLLLADSHLNIHTWPEYRYVDIDIHSCGGDSNPDKSMIHVINVLKPSEGQVERTHTGIFERSSSGLYLPPRSPTTTTIYSLSDYVNFVENSKVGKDRV